MDHISNILEGSLQGLNLRERLSEYKVHKAWREAVGIKIAEKTCPLRLKGGTLYVKAVSSPWMQELSLLKDTIIDTINKKIGERCVEEIVFKSGIIHRSRIKVEKETPWSEVSLPEGEEEVLRGRLSSLKDPELSALLLKVILKDKKLKHYLKGTKRS